MHAVTWPSSAAGTNNRAGLSRKEALTELSLRPLRRAPFRCASVFESDVPIVVQHTRLDSRQPALALLSTTASGDTVNETFHCVWQRTQLARAAGSQTLDTTESHVNQEAHLWLR
jgi:hypothetical protein